MEAQLPALHLDPISESEHHLVSIVFLKSRSPLYPYAVSVAETAERYAEADIGGKPVHYAVFGRTQAGAAHALALLDLIKNWAGVQVYAGGALQTDPWGVFNVLNCYIKALKSNDTTAHCHIRTGDPFRGPGEVMTGINLNEILERINHPPEQTPAYLFPCRFVGFMFLSYAHSAGIDDQIQSEAVRRGCDWCPLLRPSDFRKIN